MKSEFVTAITQLASEKGVPREMVMEAIQQALVSAYKQHEEDSRLITAEIDSDSGEPHVYHWLTVVEDIADDVSVWPCHPPVYHRPPNGPKVFCVRRAAPFTRGRPTYRGAG